jgi:Ran GTPase-activating protein (RanGAP) involved in mRNA processing and transport
LLAFDVSNNSIDSGISLVLQSAVSACATLQVYKPFSALHCSITPPPPPQHLSLSDNKVGHVAAAALARGISSSRFISRLELARCSIGDKGARVMQLLAPRSLTLV